jgi:CRP-like cAMP-binding protein
VAEAAARLGAPIAPPPDIETTIEGSLPGMAAQSVRALAKHGRIRLARGGEIIFQQGEEVPLILLLRGHGGFRRTTVDGQQVMVGIAYPKEIFGITSASGTIATVELVALNEVEAMLWRGDVLRRLIAEDPELALQVVDRLGLFLTILTEKVDGFLHQDARRRVIRILARHRDLFFGDPPVLSRTHLPGLVGTSREMTGRVLRELEREQIVTRVGRTGLQLLDPRPLDAEIPIPSTGGRRAS